MLEAGGRKLEDWTLLSFMAIVAGLKTEDGRQKCLSTDDRPQWSEKSEG